MTATVRRAKPADAHGIAEVHVATWRVAYRDVIPQAVLDALDVAEREKLWMRYLPSEEIAVFVAEQEGRIVGFVSVGPARDLEGIGELYAIYVHPDAWGKGAGSALMEAAVAWLAKQWSEAVLWVAEQNPRARRFLRAVRMAAGRDSRGRGPAGRPLAGAAVPPVRPRPPLVWIRAPSGNTVHHLWRLQSIAMRRPRSTQYCSSIESPCVLASLAFRLPQAGRHYLKGHR